MKSELKAKFLNHLLSKKKEEGFTLIELLVVIIIIGILSAIALPSFLNQAAKGRQSEAKQYVGTLNRLQQSNFAENGAFATTLSALSNPVPSQTTNYSYAVSATTGASASATNTSSPTTNAGAVKAYTGGVFLTTNIGANSEANTTAILCESVAPTPANNTAAAPTSGTSCATGTQVVTK
ncbi:MAG: pesticin [Leptolyngbya sp. ERB_1_1]